MEILIKNLIKIIEEYSISNIIDTNQLTLLFDIIENNKTIPISYYNKILGNVCDGVCINCPRNAIYNENNILYCWIHSQNS